MTQIVPNRIAFLKVSMKKTGPQDPNPFKESFIPSLLSADLKPLSASVVKQLTDPAQIKAQR